MCVETTNTDDSSDVKKCSNQAQEIFLNVFNWNMFISLNHRTFVVATQILRYPMAKITQIS